MVMPKSQSRKKIKWGQLIERYLHGSKQLKAVFLLIDIRHAPSANDKMMYHWIVEMGFHPIIIATKLDKIKRSQIQKQIKIKAGIGFSAGNYGHSIFSRNKTRQRRNLGTGRE